MLDNLIAPKEPMAYRLDMPAKKRPTPRNAVTASQILLDGLANDVGVIDLLSQLAPLHPRNDTLPGEVFLRLAAEALGWSGASRADPVTLEGMRARFLPECAFRGRDTHKLQFAVLAAAAQHGGAEADLLDETAWWQPTTSGSTPCSQRSPTSASPPIERVCPYPRYAEPGPAPWSAARLTRSIRARRRDCPLTSCA